MWFKVKRNVYDTSVLSLALIIIKAHIWRVLFFFSTQKRSCIALKDKKKENDALSSSIFMCFCRNNICVHFTSQMRMYYARRLRVTRRPQFSRLISIKLFVYILWRFIFFHITWFRNENTFWRLKITQDAHCEKCYWVFFLFHSEEMLINFTQRFPWRTVNS